MSTDKETRIGFGLMVAGIACVAVDFAFVGILFHRGPTFLSAVGILLLVGFVICQFIGLLNDQKRNR